MLFDVAGPVDSDIGNQNTDVTANLAPSRRCVQTALKARSIGGPHQALGYSTPAEVYGAEVRRGGSLAAPGASLRSLPPRVPW
jgi:hypothetical protein